MLAERDKHYPSRSGQTSLATAVTNITKAVTKNNFGPSTRVFHTLPLCSVDQELRSVSHIPRGAEVTNFSSRAALQSTRSGHGSQSAV